VPDWQRLVSAWLAGHRTYPPLALRRHLEGTVSLRLTANRLGRVVSASVVQSAGSAILDDAAEALVRDAVLPPFPAAMTQDKVTLTVPIRYMLTN
jgi:protein TonB